MARKKTEHDLSEVHVTYRMKDGSVFHTLEELSEYAQKITLPDHIVRLIAKICIPDL